jgi:hypothetical protein
VVSISKSLNVGGAVVRPLSRPHFVLEFVIPMRTIVARPFPSSRPTYAPSDILRRHAKLGVGESRPRPAPAALSTPRSAILPR